MWLVAENVACWENVACLAEKYGLLGNMACLIDKYGLLKKKEGYNLGLSSIAALGRFVREIQ